MPPAPRKHEEGSSSPAKTPRKSVARNLQRELGEWELTAVPCRRRRKKGGCSARAGGKIPRKKGRSVRCDARTKAIQRWHVKKERRGSQELPGRPARRRKGIPCTSMKEKPPPHPTPPPPPPPNHRGGVDPLTSNPGGKHPPQQKKSYTGRTSLEKKKKGRDMSAWYAGG